jgi:hypothetical protein
MLYIFLFVYLIGFLYLGLPLGGCLVLGAYKNEVFVAYKNEVFVGYKNEVFVSGPSAGFRRAIKKRRLRGHSRHST